MPIIGLTTEVRRQFPSLGILRKGAKRTGNAPGQDLEHFRFVNEERPEIAAAFREAYGDRPAVIPFYFQYDGIDDVWSVWQEEWVSGGLVHRCDGETMVIWRAGDGTYSHDRRPCPYHADPSLRIAKNPGCKPVGRLSILLPGLLQAGYIGDVTFLTGSKHDIMSIQGCLEEIVRYRQGMGLRGIEFLLRRDPVKISTPGPDGKRVRRTKSLITIAPTARWVQFQLQAAERAQYMLGAGDDGPEDEDDLGYASAMLPAGNGRHVEAATGEIIEPEEDSDGQGSDAELGECTEVHAPGQPPKQEPNAPAAGGQTRGQKLTLLDKLRKELGREDSQYNNHWYTGHIKKHYGASSPTGLQDAQIDTLIAELREKLTGLRGASPDDEPGAAKDNADCSAPINRHAMPEGLGESPAEAVS